MAFNPITLNKGPSAEPHIYAEDDAAIFQSMFGEDGILDIGSKLELSIQSNNLVRMSDGVLCVGGHIGRIKHADYVDLTIDNGETGYNRNDLIIGSFSNTGEHTIDTYEPQVVKGTPATGQAVDPTLTEGSLYEGEHLRQTAVARVRLEGLNIVGVDMLLPVIPSIPSLKEQIEELNSKIDNSAGTIMVGHNEEKIGTYINGNGEKEPLYSKKIQTLGSTITLPSGCNIVAAEAWMQHNTSGNKYPLPYIDTGSWKVTQVSNYQGNILNWTQGGVDWSNHTGVFVLYYTK